MANNKSAKKRILQIAVKTERNRYYRTKIKNITKAVKNAVEVGDKKEAEEALKIANRELHKYINKGVIKKGTVSRKVSRLHKLVNSIEAV
jgi:small subunit ribosomal protein S20